MKASEEKRYENLSPFELKNKLKKIAKTHSERIMLDAGRGNPNWLATGPRQAFFQFGFFAIEESLREVDVPGLGMTPQKDGIAKRYEDFLEKNATLPGVDCLKKTYEYVRDEMKLVADDFVQEMVDAILGDHYPEPDRILDNTAKIIHKYLVQEMCANNPPPGQFDLFVTEGGTAAMDYIFTSLMENKLLHKGDKIALGVPIFTPYLEIPKLNDYEFVELEIKQDKDSGWQYTDAEIEKLADPKVKAFFLVNPANPGSVAIHQATLDKIAHLVKTRRKDLIILTDDVYGTFVNGFRSLAAIAPQNTILVYSYSKYFGATGLRLGVIAIHEDNIFDRRIAAFPEKDRKELYQRYEKVILDPDKMKFIERMVADSRSVALHHTAGLSTMMQVMMVLMSLFCLVDKEGNYKKAVQYIVRHRFKTLYKAIGIPCPEDPNSAYYYTTIDVPTLAKQRYGEKFAEHLVKDHEPIDFVIKLAEKKSVVLMDGGGFDAPRMSVRVSLANLPNQAYEGIGQAISELLEEYHHNWKSSNK
ncbi:MAG: bifunctional aspartate transaminase/aspartate 4-decarboxylase [Candidatus Omnitrophota bacterium]|jgi:aspartate 4-decarboxylase